MSVRTCDYVKTGGGQCGSPAIREQRFCYYHYRLMNHMPGTDLFLTEVDNPVPGEIPIVPYRFPFLDDAAAIQIGFMQVVHGVAQRRLTPLQARLVLSALHGAASNLRATEKACAECKEYEFPKKTPAKASAPAVNKEQAG